MALEQRQPYVRMHERDLVSVVWMLENWRHQPDTMLISLQATYTGLVADASLTDDSVEPIQKIRLMSPYMYFCNVRSWGSSGPFLHLLPLYSFSLLHSSLSLSLLSVPHRRSAVR